MNLRCANPATFVIERDYAFAPTRVFSAWADKDVKFRWFASAPGWVTQDYRFDFREGGHEIWRGGPEGGEVHANNTLYWDIVPDERIIFSYEMQVEGKRITVSLATAEFKPSGKGTKLVYTEQIVFLDGADHLPEREQGTRDLLERLAEELLAH